ncbi:hypothetical protein ACH4NT_19990 [Streptomyces lydicus]
MPLRSLPPQSTKPGGTCTVSYVAGSMSSTGNGYALPFGPTTG